MIKVAGIWIDGTCLECGFPVIESGSDREGEDYRNTCTNPKCKEFYWHHCGDMESLGYYVHSSHSIPSK